MRYIIIPPVPDGDAWWYVNDTQSEIYPNFTMATFYRECPNAEAEARALCDRLNEAAPYLYVQSTGTLYRPNGSHLADCYSGNGAGLNNPDMQTVKNVGPIPVGLYALGKVDTEKGPNTIHLNPDPFNDMHGRAGFLVHGDNKAANHTASEGCIIAPPSARSEMVASGGALKVIARPASPELPT